MWYFINKLARKLKPNCFGVGFILYRNMFQNTYNTLFNFHGVFCKCEKLLCWFGRDKKVEPTSAFLVNQL